MGAILAENARGIMKMSVNAMQQDPNYKGDERDWEAIDAWGKEILAKF
jgi:hypothetical protein